MTHDELLKKVSPDAQWMAEYPSWDALRAVVKLHKPDKIPDWVPTKNELMCWCAHVYPCPTIQAIEKGLL